MPVILFLIKHIAVVAKLTFNGHRSRKSTFHDIIAIIKNDSFGLSFLDNF